MLLFRGTDFLHRTRGSSFVCLYLGRCYASGPPRIAHIRARIPGTSPRHHVRGGVDDAGLRRRFVAAPFRARVRAGGVPRARRDRLPRRHARARRARLRRARGARPRDAARRRPDARDVRGRAHLRRELHLRAHAEQDRQRGRVVAQVPPRRGGGGDQRALQPPRAQFPPLRRVVHAGRVAEGTAPAGVLQRAHALPQASREARPGHGPGGDVQGTSAARESIVQDRAGFFGSRFVRKDDVRRFTGAARSIVKFRRVRQHCSFSQSRVFFRGRNQTPPLVRRRRADPPPFRPSTRRPRSP